MKKRTETKRKEVKWRKEEKKRRYVFTGCLQGEQEACNQRKRYRILWATLYLWFLWVL